jgi:hypothetical protein
VIGDQSIAGRVLEGIPTAQRTDLGCTAIMSTLVFVPVWIAGLVLGIETTQELPSPAFVVGALVLGVVPILLATVGSDIIYGLRRQVSEAMQLGQYTLDRKIGEGGNARCIARTMPCSAGEVQHMSQLTYPNTVAVFDYGHSPDGVFYYVMEYLGGIDLEYLVKLLVRSHRTASSRSSSRSRAPSTRPHREAKPPRHQAGQHPPVRARHRARCREGRRLRPGQGNHA